MINDHQISIRQWIVVESHLSHYTYGILSTISFKCHPYNMLIESITLNRIREQASYQTSVGQSILYYSPFISLPLCHWRRPLYAKSSPSLSPPQWQLCHASSGISLTARLDNYRTPAISYMCTVVMGIFNKFHWWMI